MFHCFKIFDAEYIFNISVDQGRLKQFSFFLFEVFLFCKVYSKLERTSIYIKKT